MPEWMDAFAATELADGSRRFVRLGGCDVALFRVHDLYYAIEDSCPHNGASLVSPCRSAAVHRYIQPTQTGRSTF